MRVRLDKIASSTRNAALHARVVVGEEIPAVPGTVVVVRVLDEKAVYNQIEDVHGRMMTVHAGDVVAGVLGAREALRGYSGVVPDSVRPGDVLELLNLGGIIGRCTAWSPDVGPPARVEVLGAVLRFPELGRRVGVPASIFPGPVPMADTLGPLPPVVFIVGSCMHAGKTRAACALVREATRRGLHVAAAKITGVALRRDTLEMLDHGAIQAVSFADAGLPSTTGVDVLGVARGCMRAAAEEADLLLVELGDGLLGSYGVRDVLAAPDIRAAASAVILAATDPVAAWGGAMLLEQLGLRATVITGPATDNEAGNRAIAENVPGVAIANANRAPKALADAVLGAAGLMDWRMAAGT